MWSRAIWCEVDEGVDRVDVDIKAATKAFGKKFSCGASSEKNAENMMEVTVQGDVVQELAAACNELYDVVYFRFSHL